MNKRVNQLFFGNQKAKKEFERSLSLKDNGFKFEKYYRTEKGRWYKEVIFEFGESKEEHIEILRDLDIIDLFLSENNTEFLRKYFPNRYNHLEKP